MYRCDCDWTADQLAIETRRGADYLDALATLIRQAQADCPDIIGFQEIEIALEDPISTTRAQINEIDDVVRRYEEAS